LELAKDLLTAARQTRDTDYAVELCFQAYAFGSRQIKGYQTAAAALDLAQQLAPDRRVDCLDRLRFLYDTAFERSPHKLQLGAGLADVLSELAQSRYDEATGGFEVGRYNADKAEQLLAPAVTELERSVATMRQVLNRAASDRTKAAELGRDDLAEALQDFVDEHRPDLDEYIVRHEHVEAAHERFRQLAGMIDRFNVDPSAKNAQSVAAMYLVEFDQPERIRPQVIAALPGSMSGPAKLAASRVDALDADEALMLSRWYRDLHRLAQTDASRQDMLVRARLYADRVRELNDDRADPMRGSIVRDLAAAGLPRERIDERVEALEARLAAIGHGATLVIADPSDSTLSDASEDEDQTMLSDASNDTVGGRPMSVCEKCGREFFPGWGVKASTCDRCKNGHRNIFDFGQ